MRISLVGRNLDSPRGGGELSTLSLLEALSENHRLSVFNVSENKEIYVHRIKNTHMSKWVPPRILTKPYLPFQWRTLGIEMLSSRVFDEQLKRDQPDLLIIVDPAMIRLPRHLKAKTIFFVRGHDWRYYTKFANNISRMRNEIGGKIRNIRNRKILERMDLIIANSKFMAETLRKFGISSAPIETVYPFITLSSYRVRDKDAPGKYITFINPSYLKGIEIFRKIVKELPRKKFIVVGKGIEKLKNITNNVTCFGWSDDIRDIYKNTSIILFPSIWDEPFGRVPIEAGINGIPTIASNRGGLPESVGKGGILIDNPYDINAWLSAIKRIESDRKNFSNKSILNANKFAFERSYDNFKKIVGKNLNLDI
jgi:glycosyltransferase involved in cell wall biosynthesis